MIHDAAPQGRRVTALAASGPSGPTPQRDVVTAERTGTSDDLIGLLRRLPWAQGPRVVMRDNAGLHPSQVIRPARREFSRTGLDLDVLPPSSPERNEIEPVFRQVKDHAIPERSHTTRLGLREAIERGFGNSGRKRPRKYSRELHPTA